MPRSHRLRQSQAALSDFRRGIPEARPVLRLDTIDATVGGLIDQLTLNASSRKWGCLHPNFHKVSGQDNQRFVRILSLVSACVGDTLNVVECR